jgi:hypothetical protein
MDEPTKDDEDSTLYVMSMCMVCRNKTYTCHYCNGEGKTYIQASDRTIAKWISNLNKERKEDIMKGMAKGRDNGTG